MTTLTKLLPADAQPAQPILDRAHDIVLTSEQRAQWGDVFETAEGPVNVAVEERRPLEVDDVFVDDKGDFWVVRPAVERVLHVSGDMRTLQEAAQALISRGVPVAEAPEGFAVLPMPNIAKMLGMIGLEVTEVDEPFVRIRFEQMGGGCGCGGGGCGCGGHHHDDEGCGCGGHHHHDEGCGCGGHHHHEEDACGCGCGGHHHHEEDACGCGCGDHHHEEDACGCGCGDHHHEEDACGCGCGDHHHEEESCCCGGGDDCCSADKEEKKEDACGCGCGSHK